VTPARTGGMTRRESEVPTDLKRLIRKASGGYRLENFFSRQVPDLGLPEECPDCGDGLAPAIVFATASDEPVAVRLECEGVHREEFVATYLYDLDDGKLHFESEERREESFDDLF